MKFLETPLDRARSTEGADRRLEEHIVSLLEATGEDLSRNGLAKTPERAVQSFRLLTSGYQRSPGTLIRESLFSAPYSDMVVVQDIEFYSLCEHHLLPFYGKCHVAYIPQGKCVGLSAIPRVVEIFSRRLQIQERLTTEIAACLMENLGATGVGVVLDGSHLCMLMRGLEKQASTVRTLSLLGQFQSAGTRQEFLNLIK